MIGFSLGLNGAGLPSGDMPFDDPVAEIDILGEGTLVVSFVGENVEITITGTASADGTYVVDQSALAAGPVNLVPPALPAGVATAGDSLAITPGLWVYDIDNGMPTIGYVHDGSGSISGLGYLSGPADAGATITVTEQVSQGGVQASATSNAVTFEGVAASGPELLGMSLGGVEQLPWRHWGEATATPVLTIDTTGRTVGDTVFVVWGDDRNIASASINGTPVTIVSVTPPAGTFRARLSVLSHVLQAGEIGLLDIVATLDGGSSSNHRALAMATDQQLSLEARDYVGSGQQTGSWSIDVAAPVNTLLTFATGEVGFFQDTDGPVFAGVARQHWERQADRGGAYGMSSDLSPGNVAVSISRTNSDTTRCSFATLLFEATP